MKTLLILLLTSLSLTTFAIDYAIVDESVCKKRGHRLYACKRDQVTLALTQHDPIIPLETIVTVNTNSYCRTQFPMSLIASFVEGESYTFNALRPATHTLTQPHLNGLTLSIDAPYARVAYFDHRCQINTTVDANKVNVPELRNKLASSKVNITHQLVIIDDRIADKSTINRFIDIIDLYKAVVELAEKELVSFSELNIALQENCDGIAACTWSDQIGVLLEDENILLPFSQEFLLFQLGADLDRLVATDCATNNCIAPLVDEQTVEIINNATDSINTSILSDEIKQLLAERAVLVIDRDNLREIATDYNLDWFTL